MYSLPRKLLAEFLGTFSVVFLASGVFCSGQALSAAGMTRDPWLVPSLAYGLAVAIAVTSVGHISGGHLNPAVTIAFWVTKRFTTLQSLLYWFAQLLGALAAAFLLTAIFPDAIWRPVALGTPAVAAPDFTRIHAMGLEAALTFLLVFVFLATCADAKGAFNKIAGFAVGLTVTLDVLVGGPFTGASMNPARSFGPALVSHQWMNHGVYWVGPLFGGVLAGVIYDRAFLRDQPPV